MNQPYPIGFPDRLTGTRHTVVLTPAELRLARLVACGLNNDEIAVHLYRSANTIRTNLSRVMDKAEVGNRCQLIDWLYQTRHLAPGQPTFATPPPAPAQAPPEPRGDQASRALPVVAEACADLDSALTHLGSI